MSSELYPFPLPPLKGAESKIQGQSGTWLSRVVSMAVPELSGQGSDWSLGLVPAEAEPSEQSLSSAPEDNSLYPLIPTYYLS